jgi:TPR repeat protein/uncharacterized protein YecT (DUF1311 family)
MLQFLLCIMFLLSIMLQAYAGDSLREAAEKGDANAQLAYGKLLVEESSCSSGKGCPPREKEEKNKKEAALWIQKAADQGLAEAWFWLAYAGLGTEDGAYYYTKAAEKGYPQAFEQLLGFTAGGSPEEIKEQKRLADLARKLQITSVYPKTLKAIDYCYEAGKPVILAADLPTAKEKEDFNRYAFEERISALVNRIFPRLQENKQKAEVQEAMNQVLTNRKQAAFNYQNIHNKEDLALKLQAAIQNAYQEYGNDNDRKAEEFTEQLRDIIDLDPLPYNPCLTLNPNIRAGQNLDNYRKCLLSQTEYDYSAIAEMYANGWGVKENATLAMAFLCSNGTTSDNITQLHLGGRLDMCDGDTITLNTCSGIRENIEMNQKPSEMVDIMKGWTPPQKKAFSHLEYTAEDFFRSTTSSAENIEWRVSSFEDRTNYLSEFYQTIKSSEAGKLPSDTAADKAAVGSRMTFAQADKKLNELYSRLMKEQFHEEDFGITKDGIKTTQRKWLKYRDAWVAFAHVRYPDSAPDLWKTWLTKKRILQLERLVDIELGQQ